MPSPKPTAEAVWRALHGVIDPCSRFNGSRLSLFALGMIDDVSVDADGVAQIRLLLDDPTCLYLVEIHKEISAAAVSVPGVTAANVTVAGDELWTRDRLTPEARAKLERGRLLTIDRSLLSAQAGRQPRARTQSPRP
jgi:metal-sulfur cluster biosynthetic enzyme